MRGKKIKTDPAALTSMKVSMLSISAWARPMMNWFTHAMACDLRKRKGQGGIYYAALAPRREAKSEDEEETKNRLCTDLILGLQCLKNCRNLGIMMLSGRFRASLSNSSEESSQIFCKAPKEPWATGKQNASNVSSRYSQLQR